MFRRSTNNPWISPSGFINGGYFAGLGGTDAQPVLATAAGARFPGLLGQTVVHSNSTALKDSNTTVGTLFAGVYQLVKFSTAVAGTTGFAGTVKQGSLVFWDTLANNGQATFTVTDVVTATSDFKAGVVVSADTAIANVAGQFGWIQVAGLATVLYGTVTSAVIGNTVIQTSLTTNTFDAIADAGTTFATNGGAKLFVGTAYELPATGTLKRVWMSTEGVLFNIA